MSKNTENTEQSLARIFAICDQVAETGETIRAEDEGIEDARLFLGAGRTNKLDTFSENP